MAQKDYLDIGNRTVTNPTENDVEMEWETTENILNQKVINLVIDTNIFLHHLSLVESLLGESKFKGKFHLLIPWMVLKELDCIKTKSEEKSKLEILGRKASLLIHNHVKESNPNVQLQTLEEHQSQSFGSSDNADDNILLWCLHLKKKDISVILLSDDIILCTKARGSWVHSVTKEEFVDKVLNKLNSAQEICAFNKNHNYQLHSETNTAVLPRNVESNESKTRLDNIRHILVSEDDFLNRFESYVLEPLSKVLEHEMKLAFEDMWEQIVLVKPPWKLMDVLRCIDKHWIAVFSYIYSRELKEKVCSLMISIKKSKCTVLDKDTKQSMVDTAASSLCFITERRPEFLPFINPAVKLLKNLLPSAKESFDHDILEILNALWQKFYDESGQLKEALHRGSSSSLVTLPSYAEAMSRLPIFLSFLKVLESALSRFAHEEDRCRLLMMSKEVSQILLDGIAQFNLGANVVQLSNLPGAMTEFLLNNEQLVKNGWNNLKNIISQFE